MIGDRGSKTTDVEGGRETKNFNQTKPIKFIDVFDTAKPIAVGQSIDFDIIADSKKSYSKKITVTKVESIGTIVMLDGRTENGNPVQIEFDIYDKDNAIVRYIAPDSGKDVSEDSIEPYDQGQMNFSEWIEKNNEAIFNRYAAHVFHILEDLKKEGTLTSLSDSDFFTRLRPALRPVGTPISDEIIQQISKKLLSPVDVGGAGLKPKHTEQEESNLANIYLGSTGKATGTEPVRRKLYLSPDFEKVDQFIQELYKILERIDASIISSKIHTDDAQRNNKHEIIAQAHNTYVLYLPNDEEVPKVLFAIKEAQINTAVHLNTFAENEVPKAPLLLNNQVIVGGEDSQLSFDNWANSLAYKARQFFLKKGSVSLSEIKQVMVGEMQYRTGKSPAEYLSVGK